MKKFAVLLLLLSVGMFSFVGCSGGDEATDGGGDSADTTGDDSMADDSGADDSGADDGGADDTGADDSGS